MREREKRNIVEEIYLDLVGAVAGPVCGSVCASARTLRVVPVSCDMPTAYWVVVRCAWNLTRELFQSLALGFRDEQSGKDTQDHE